MKIKRIVLKYWASLNAFEKNIFIRRIAFSTALVFLIFAAGVGNLIWHRTHGFPLMPGHFPLMHGLDEIEAFRAQPLGHVLEMLREQPENFFSLYYVLASLVTSVLGMSYLNLALTSTLLYLLMIFLAYTIVARDGNEWGGIAAAMTMTLAPVFFGWSRTFSPIMSCLAIPLLGVWLALRSRGFTRLAPSLFFGALAALSLRFGSTFGESISILVVFVLVGGLTVIMEIIGGGKTKKGHFCIRSPCSVLFPFC